MYAQMDWNKQIFARGHKKKTLKKRRKERTSDTPTPEKEKEHSKDTENGKK